MTIEKTLFAAADKMRGAMDAGKYKHITLSLLFLHYVSISFQRLHDELAQDEYADAEDRDDYLARNVFWVPEKARWSSISKSSKNPEIGIMLDDAMREIEAANESLKGALPKVFGKEIHLGKKDIDKFEVTSQGHPLLREFGKAVNLMLGRIVACGLENQSLTTLLPKLMSGELRVRKAQELLEEVA